MLYDLLTGPCIREITFKGSPEKALYLTFDDGPHPACTPEVLALLKRYQVKATFFVIGLKAKQYPELISQILQEGHTIGDHSLDHDTKNYFKNEGAISEWLEKSAKNLNELGIKSIGFRSPVGIKTPHLNQALANRGEPLILWSARFFDTAIGLNLDAVERKNLKSGDIILLHDTHTDSRKTNFLKALEQLILKAHTTGFTFHPLERCLVHNSYKEKYET